MILDHPAWAALNGPQAPLATRSGNAVRYPAELAPFADLPPRPTDADWAALGTLAAGEPVVILGARRRVPPGWRIESERPGLQMIAAADFGSADPEVVELGEAHFPAMLSLAAETKPGPFAARTATLGRYLGIIVDGELVAMAGERFHLEGWTEISAVCTAAQQRGRGLANRLVSAVAAGIRDRGERAFLHVVASNTTAIGVYERLGFVARQSADIVVQRLRPPGSA